MANKVQCIKRTYRIETSEGIKMDVESDQPLSGAATAKLLEEDCELKSFLDKCNILSIEIPEKEKVIKRTERKRSKKKSSLKRIRHKKADIDKGREVHNAGETPDDQGIKSDDNIDSQQEQHQEENEQTEGKLTPCDRINTMLTMDGEFTRKDYQKFMEENKNFRMNDFMGHSDIEDAVVLGRIEETGERLEKGLRRYRIIDARPIEQYMFRKIKKSYKKKMIYNH